MNKKGFTLIELLAVIAILAILVLIALPNIMGTFINSKENIFLDEVKNIYRTAEGQIIVDSISEKSTYYYSNFEENKLNELSLSGGENITYCIIFNSNYKIVHLSASSPEYSFTSNNTKGITITSIDKTDENYSKVDFCSSNQEDLIAHKRLEYIESVASDNQYIEINYTFKQNTKVEVDGMVIKGDTAIFGARNAQNNILGTQRYTLQYVKTNEYRLSYRKTDYTLNKSWKLNTRHLWTVSETGLLIDNTSVVSILPSKSSGVDSKNNIYLMCVNDKNQGGAINFGQVRIYSFKIYEGDTLVMDIIPVLNRKGVPCMFDKISEEFYYNKSSGTFNHGPEIPDE